MWKGLLGMEGIGKRDELLWHADEGTLTIEGSNDVLTQAMGTEKHSGAVWGVGALVTPTSFFHTPQPTSGALNVAMKEISVLKKYMEAMVSEMHKRGFEMPEFCINLLPSFENVGSNSAKFSAVGQGSPDLSHSSWRAASSMGRQLDLDTHPSLARPPTDKRRKKAINMTSKPIRHRRLCLQIIRLALRFIDRIVAKASLHDGDASNLLHGSRLGEGNARVEVVFLEKPEYGIELLPIPLPGAANLLEAIRGFVAWPRDRRRRPLGWRGLTL